MGFWVFMLIMNLLTPLTMILFGNYFYNKAPKEINSVFGYRTTMSMKNKETWNFAHHYCGNLWRIAGWILFAISLVVMLLVFNKNADTTGIFGGILCGVQLLVLIGTIFPTERALKKNYDSNGLRKI